MENNNVLAALESKISELCDITANAEGYEGLHKECERLKAMIDEEKEK